MAAEALIHYTCDRCGVEKALPANVGPMPERPDHWHSIQFFAPGATSPSRKLDVCPDCIAEVGEFLTGGKLIPIGHFRQSGSGKSWTELGLEHQSDPERWRPAYAFDRTTP